MLLLRSLSCYYRPLDKGDNTFGSVRPSVCLAAPGCRRGEHVRDLNTHWSTLISIAHWSIMSCYIKRRIGRASPILPLVWQWQGCIFAACNLCQHATHGEGMGHSKRTFSKGWKRQSSFGFEKPSWNWFYLIECKDLGHFVKAVYTLVDLFCEWNAIFTSL